MRQINAGWRADEALSAYRDPAFHAEPPRRLTWSAGTIRCPVESLPLALPLLECADELVFWHCFLSFVCVLFRSVMSARSTARCSRRPTPWRMVS
jgi:hypothetical protein